jgi:hypothetical protein
MRRFAVAALALTTLSCQAPAGRAPVVRFSATPKYVPLGDGYTTVVTLDGTLSKDEIDDPEGLRPLRFRWELDDPAPQVVQGGLAEPTVQVKLQGDRPTTVILTVVDEDGQSASRTGSVGVIVAPPGDGDGGAAAGD